MALNTIETATLFQTNLDLTLQEDATSSFLEINPALIKYEGGAEVKMPRLDMDGLGDYIRGEGFVAGSVTFDYETYKLTQDRGRLFQFDEMDVDETGFVMTAPTVMNEFQRTRVVPEIDAYRYSKIAQEADKGSRALYGYTPSEKDILQTLLKDIAKVEDVIGDSKNLIIIMSTMTSSILNGSEKISKRLDVTDFSRGEITSKVQSLDGIPIVKVPSIRFKTEYEFKTGKDNEGGFKATETAQDINWIILERSSAMAVSKTDKVRIFTPEQNQKARSWQTDYRKFHDLWVLKNKLDGILVNINGEKPSQAEGDK